jgi:hypothetical protein
MIVKHTKPFVTYFGDIFLYPGNNEVSAENSTILLNDPKFQDALKAGMVEVLDKTVPIQINKTSTKSFNAVAPVVKQAVRVSIAGMALPNATKVIAGMFNKAELVRIAGTDMRKGIQDAIKAQLAKVDAMAKEKVEETEEATEA